MFVAVHDPVPERRAHGAGDTLPDQGRVAGDRRVEGVPAVVGVAVELTRDRVLEGAGYEAGLGGGGWGEGGGKCDCSGECGMCTGGRVHEVRGGDGVPVFLTESTISTSMGRELSAQVAWRWSGARYRLLNEA